MPIPNNIVLTSELESASFRNNTAKTSERKTRAEPMANVTKMMTALALKGTLGCGVERSRLPHCEQTSACRGFTCSLGQSFMS